MNNLTRIDSNSNSDFQFDGKIGSMSRRKLAELCGADKKAISYWLNKSGEQKRPQTLAMLSQYSLASGEQIPDILCAAFLKYYAYEGNEVAQKNDLVISAIGIRTWIKQESGYQEHEIPKTYAAALMEAAKLALENERLLAQAAEDKPKVDFADAIAVSADNLTMNEFAKIIKTGRTRLFRALREKEVVMKNSTLPYQKYIDAGYFDVTETITEIGLVPYTTVTGKGQLWLCDKLGIKAQSPKLRQSALVFPDL